MATVTHDDLSVCTDCAMIVSNGQLGQGDESADRAHAEKIAEQWQGVPGQLVLAGGEDEEAWFSSYPCDGCGSTLGGDRLQAARLT